MFNKKSAIFSSVTALAFLFLLSSCMKNDDYTEIIGEASVKIVNTVESSEPQDFYQNDKKISTTAVGYGQTSDYLTIIAGTATTVTFRNSGTATVNATGFIAPQLGLKYMMFYYFNSIGEGVVSGLLNDTNAPAAGKIKVRFLNLGATLSNSINVETSASTPLVTSLAYNYASPYHLFDDNLDLAVKLTGATTAGVVIPNTAFQTGKNYTVWFDAANPTTPRYHVVLEN